MVWKKTAIGTHKSITHMCNRKIEVKGFTEEVILEFTRQT